MHQQPHGALQLLAALLPLPLRQPLVLLVDLAHVLLQERGWGWGENKRVSRQLRVAVLFGNAGGAVMWGCAELVA